MTRDEARHHELERMLATAIGPACHELRSPLAVVYGFARMIQADESVDPAHISHIVEGSERLDSLLDQLATIGRIATGRTEPELRELLVDPMLAEVMRDSRAGERLSVLGACEQPVYADGDWLAAAIEEIVEGLCYDPSMRVQVAPQAHAGGVRLVLSVDSNMPLPEREEGRCSLRLALARMRITAMGGSMRVRDFGLEIDVPSRRTE